jgi:sugar transferase (PEP-CTERM system associated)
VPHIRIFRHYVHTPLILLAAGELVIIAACFYLGHYTRFGDLEAVPPHLIGALTFAFTNVACMVAMGVYESRIREGMTGMLLRTAVAIFLLGAAAMAILIYVFPVLDIGRGVLLVASVEAFAAVTIFRWIVFVFVDEERFKTRVLVLGTGHRAVKIASRMRRRTDQRAFKLAGFLEPGNATVASPDSASVNGSHAISAYAATIIQTDLPLPEYCEHNGIEEIVVAMDERRRNVDAVGGLPLEELLECRLRGIRVCDVQQFIEREAGKLDVDLLRPSWMVFSDGFIVGSWREFSKRLFDVLASSLLLLVAWPFMLVTILCIWLEDGFRSPIFYRQTRIGLDGKPFDVIKFRSMRVDAEKAGEAVWATRNDARITRVGAFIRKSRIDELPQLFNVLRGNMSFVGPRPERPIFVEELNQKIPFYNERHRIKPGITGWAQLCYPYGASVEDAKEKLQYDLYYLKNNSLLLDLVILLQTVEVVLVGDGAR